MSSIIHPCEKLLELGPSALTDEELLAILIGSGHKGKSAKEIAKELLDNYYSIPGLMGRKLSDLMKIKGLKEMKTSRIVAAFEIARRVIKTIEKE